MKKAIFFDIDGTLLDSMNGQFEISEAVQVAIHKLRAHGNYVFIATGRPYAFLNDSLKHFGFDGFILANGAHIMVNDQTIYKDAMDQNTVEKLLTTFDSYGMEYILETECKSYLESRFHKFQELHKQFFIPQEFIGSEYEQKDVEVLKIEALCPDRETVERCETIVTQYDGYGIFQSLSSTMVEIYQTKNTKASAILHLLDYLDLDVAHSYAFGDGINDIEMLETVGCGIAMGNATDYVKSFAKKITHPVQKDGVATGIEQYILV